MAPWISTVDEFDMKFWMVRAARNGLLAPDFKDKSIVATGWHEVGDLTSIQDLQQMRAVVAVAYPDMEPGAVINAAGVTDGQDFCRRVSVVRQWVCLQPPGGRGSTHPYPATTG
jgi:hypothetical protein